MLETLFALRFAFPDIACGDIEFEVASFSLRARCEKEFYADEESVLPDKKILGFCLTGIVSFSLKPGGTGVILNLFQDLKKQGKWMTSRYDGDDAETIDSEKSLPRRMLER